MLNQQKAQYREILAAELASRKQRNPHYSLRAMARSLGLHPADLCNILAGKRAIGGRAALKIVAGLTEDVALKVKFIESVFDEKKNKALAELYGEDREETPLSRH